MRYLSIDVETPNRKNDRISAFGYVLVEDQEVIDRGEYLCNPETEFDSFNIELTGVSPEDVADAPTFPELMEKAAPLFRDSIIVAHNASFDLSVLKKCFDTYGMEQPQIQYLDTLRLMKKYYPGLESYSLDALMERGNVEIDHHKAGSDAMACACLLDSLIACGCPVNDSIATYCYCGGSRGIGRKLTYETLSIREFLDILQETSADDVLTEGEFFLLVDWVINHQELQGEYQYDRMVSLLKDVTADGEVDEGEIREILRLCRELVDPLSCTKCTATIEFSGKTFCLSGDFSHGSKSEVSKMLTDRGATEKSGVTQKLDYLFVGGCGSTAWACGNYGTKVTKALDLQAKGFGIQIISEEDLFAVLQLG